MKNLALLLTLLAIMATSCSNKKDSEPEVKKTMVMAYVDASQVTADASRIVANNVTHVNCAFASVQDGKAVLNGNATDATKLKEQKADLKLILSVKGKGLANAVATSEGQKTFAKSVAELVKAGNWDGAEIEWEAAELKKDEEANKETFALAVAAIKTELDAIGQDKKLLFGAVVCGCPNFIANNDVAKAQTHLDYLNIKVDGFQSEKIATHRSNLYPTEKYKEPAISIDATVKAYIAAGVPADKLIMNISFAGKVYIIKKGSNQGLGDPITGTDKEIGYTDLKDKYANQNEFYRYWDDGAQVPYLYNFYKQTFITYDDEESLKAKCNYIKENEMGGIAINGFNYDTKNYLMKTINQFFK